MCDCICITYCQKCQQCQNMNIKQSSNVKNDKITKQKKSKRCQMTNANINHEILGKIGTYCEISVDLVRSQ